MKLWGLRRGYHLEPLNLESQEVLERIPQRKLVEIEVLQRRNSAHNALYFVMLHRIAKWLDQDGIDNDVLHDFFKLETGVILLIRLPNGETRKVPGSTEYSRMDQVAFGEFFERAVRVAYEKLQVPPPLLADLLMPGR